MGQTVSHRRRFVWGLLLGTVLGVCVAEGLLIATRRAEDASRQARVAAVTLRALSDVLERAGVEGDAARRAVTMWSAAEPSVRTVRVVRFEGVSLEASTAPEDQGGKAAPRRLLPDEKPLYDRGQRLRAAVQTNREEGAARKQEIETDRSPSGALSLAAPLERDGSVVGMIQIEKLPEPRARLAPSILFFAALLAPAAIFLLLSAPIRNRRAALALLSGALLAATLFVYIGYSLRVIESERRATEAGVSARMLEEKERAGSVLDALGIAPSPPLSPATWNVDAYRKARGSIADQGEIRDFVLRAELARDARYVRRAGAALMVLGLGLLAFVGFGAAAMLRRTLIKHRHAYFYAAPAMIGMIVLVFFPFIYGIALSFTDSTLYNTNKPITELWAGLHNYVEILGDFSMVKRTAGGIVVNYLNFYWTFFFTIVWTVTNVTLGVTSGLILALILNTRGLKLRPLYRVLLILPWAMPNYITALIWRGMFHQQFGVINQAVQLFGGTPLAWFDKPFTAFLTVLATNGWLSFPFMMVVSLGALQSIPGEIYEAARIDGATRWQQFRTITLPSLRPALIPAIILSVIWTFNMFNIIYLVTQGEPGSATEILITQSYKFAFEKYRYGYAAAYSTVIFAILLVYGTLQSRITKATEAIA